MRRFVRISGLCRKTSSAWSRQHAHVPQARRLELNAPVMTAAIVPDHAPAPSHRSFTPSLWLCWIAAAAFGESLRLLAFAWYIKLGTHEHTVDDAFAALIYLLQLYGLIVSFAATAQWLVLRRMFPDLDLGWWLLVSGIAALTMFFILLIWISSSTGVPPRSFSYVASRAVFLITSGIAEAFVLALFALAWVAGRWPHAFILCAILAAAVTAPLYVVAEEPLHYFSSAWVRYPTEPTAQLAFRVPLRLAAAGLGAAITGVGLRLLMARGPRA
jgi:hypothetical protein